ncbi:MAG: ATP-binding protein, partial [Deltaproteobacteria bacterium]|nr:ATP-binding protein [Deltaproteobacteria bacterium]
MSQSMVKIFNTTGPCVPFEHYMLPVLGRLKAVKEMIEGKYYFVLYAPRQSGKTTYLDILTEKINSEGQYYALNCPFSGLRDISDNEIAMTTIVTLLNDAMYSSNINLIKQKAFKYDSFPGMNSAVVKVKRILISLCEDLDKELIVFFDEADTLSGAPLIIFLEQIRLGYQSRHKPGNKFPRSLALVGMRDIRDYLETSEDLRAKAEGSPFNIKKESLTLANFTQSEIATLYHQHTEASGQVFEPLAVERAWYWSEGQPWLVNALAYEALVKILNNNYSLA